MYHLWALFCTKNIQLILFNWGNDLAIVLKCSKMIKKNNKTASYILVGTESIQNGHLRAITCNLHRFKVQVQLKYQVLPLPPPTPTKNLTVVLIKISNAAPSPTPTNNKTNYSCLSKCFLQKLTQSL